jgi:Cft2 family RNA processing exonuclease
MKITFYGGAREVGGSCVILKTEDVKIALDYGIRVMEKIQDSLPRYLDAVVISHAYLDHSGAILNLAGTKQSWLGLKLLVT